MRISAVLTLAAFPLILAGQQAAQPGGQQDWRFAHPDATLVASIRPSAVLNSPLLSAAITSANAAKGNDPSAAAMLSMATQALSGISEIRFSILDNGTPEPDMVALIVGKLDDGMLAMLGQSAKYRRIGENSILFGNGDSLDKAAARMAQTTPVLQPRALAGTETLAPYDLWISGKLPDLASAIPQGALPLPSGLKLNLRGIAMGLSMRDNVEMQLSMETASAAMAESLLKSAHEAEAAQPVQFRGMLQSFIEGSTAHFRLNVPREAALEALRTGMKAAPALAAGNTPQPAQVTPLAPRRATIKIEGLEGGPIEIPLQ